MFQYDYTKNRETIKGGIYLFYFQEIRHMQEHKKRVVWQSERKVLKQ